MTDKHFKLREDLSITFLGRKLFRIEATKDLKKHNVKAGDIGGYIEKESNLSGNAWVYDNAKVFGDAKVYGNAKVCGNAWVYGNAKVFGDAWVYGNAKVCGDTISKSDDLYNISSNSQYNITILPHSIKIGCQFHKKEDWWNFTDREIIEMDGKDALKWWRVWKPILQAICEVQNDR